MIHTTRRAFLVTVSAVALTACGSNLLGPPDAGQIYVLNPAPPPAAVGTPVNWALAIMRPTAAGGLDTDRIALIQGDGTMDYYASATYPDTLPTLVQGVVAAGFQASRRIAQVSREQDALHSDYYLFLTIRNFEAHYSAKGAAPAVNVTLDAQLATTRGRKIVANFTASEQGQAGADSAGAATEALSAALGQAIQAVVAWALGALPPQMPDTP